MSTKLETSYEDEQQFLYEKGGGFIENTLADNDFYQQYQLDDLFEDEDGFDTFDWSQHVYNRLEGVFTRECEKYDITNEEHLYNTTNEEDPYNTTNEEHLYDTLHQELDKIMHETMAYHHLKKREDNIQRNLGAVFENLVWTVAPSYTDEVYNGLGIRSIKDIDNPSLDESEFLSKQITTLKRLETQVNKLVRQVISDSHYEGDALGMLKTRLKRVFFQYYIDNIPRGWKPLEDLEDIARVTVLLKNEYNKTHYEY